VSENGRLAFGTSWSLHHDSHEVLNIGSMDSNDARHLQSLADAAANLELSFWPSPTVEDHPRDVVPVLQPSVTIVDIMRLQTKMQELARHLLWIHGKIT
jgi:hypothetical protein